MNRTVNTTEYQFTHGRKPRGQGSWAFECGVEVVFFATSNQTYTAALREARAFAASRNLTVTKVCS